MPSDVAPVTLTLGGNDIQDIDGIFLELRRGGPGEHSGHRGPDYIAPHLAGRVLGNRQPDYRRVSLFGFVRGTGADEDAQRGDYSDNRILLASYVTMTTEAALSATLPSGDEYTLNVRGISDGAILYNEIVPAFAWCSVELESLDPDWVLVTGS